MKKVKKFLSIFMAITLLFVITFNVIVTVNAASDISSATNILVNNTYTGNIENGSDYEKDYYKFTTSKDGYVTIDFTNSSPTSSSDEAWDVALLTSYGSEEITSSVVNLNNSKKSLTTIGLSAGTYYICVQSAKWNYAVAESQYSVYANFIASDNWEKEFNEDSSASSLIKTNETYYGTTRNGSDYEKDYYKFTTSKDGYVTVDFTNSSPTSSTDEAWNVALLTNYGSEELTSSVVNLNNSEKSLTTIGLNAGTYYIRVQSVKWNYAVSDSKYSICADFTASNDWEKEYNEDSSASNLIETNKTYYGTTRNGSDYEKDYYKFTTSKDGYVTIDFTNSSPTSSTGEAWNVALLTNYGSEELTSSVVNLNNSDKSLTTIGLSAGTYYIRVQSVKWNYAVSDSKYSIYADFTADDNWEKEFNEDGSTATPISTQEKYTGTIRNGYDYEKDYYTFTTTGNGTIDITFYNDTSRTSTSEAWNMYVYDSTFTELASKTIKVNEASVNIQLSGRSSGTYYICVQSTKWNYAEANTPYKLKIVGVGIPVSSDTTKPTGSISSTNNIAIGQTVTLKLSDNVGVAGYYWGTSSTYSNNTYTSTSSASVTKTISDAGTYYLTVRDTSGNISSSYSITFYKTTLNANGGSVSPSYIITKSGISVTLPTPTKSNSTFLGWGTSSTSASGVTAITPTSNKTYYAVWEDNSSVTLGDINGDGTIDAGDAVIISRYDAGLITLTADQLIAGDINGDGMVDAGDAVIISRYDAGLISSLN